MIWLLRKLRPDFKTIADFRKENGAGIKAVCREFTLLCRKLELFGGELVAIDSTKIKAQNAKARNDSAARVAAQIKEAEEKRSAAWRNWTRPTRKKRAPPTVRSSSSQAETRRFLSAASEFTLAAPLSFPSVPPA